MHYRNENMLLILSPALVLQVKEKDDRLIEHKTEMRDDADGDYHDRQVDHRSQQQTKDDGKQKNKQQKKKKLEPSLKWRALGMEEYKEG